MVVSQRYSDGGVLFYCSFFDFDPLETETESGVELEYFTLQSLIQTLVDEFIQSSPHHLALRVRIHFIFMNFPPSDRVIRSMTHPEEAWTSPGLMTQIELEGKGVKGKSHLMVVFT